MQEDEPQHYRQCQQHPPDQHPLVGQQQVAGPDSEPLVAQRTGLAVAAWVAGPHRPSSWLLFDLIVLYVDN
jgi:hypothetical protein|tara:strand:- start:490 stop:702 length:213 start_codon:yes stop_codon:yes gene_type:complete